jgi:hypothetical protein
MSRFNVGDGTNINISDIDIITAIKELRDEARIGLDTNQLTESEAKEIIAATDEPNTPMIIISKIGEKLVDISMNIGSNVATAYIKTKLGI